jgi:hypothetical protein
MDENGQLILISGFLIAISLVVLTLMLNSIIYTGNIAYEGTMDTHERNMQEINRLTIDEISYARNLSHDQYVSYMSNYTAYVTSMEAYKGASVSIDYSGFNDASNEGNVIISYADPSIQSKYSLHIDWP